MSRPQKNRIVSKPPLYASFKPTGIQKSRLQQITLTLDEYEAIRLADYLNMEHKEAAEEMEISRPTFTRLIDKAHAKAAAFLVEGKELCIQGGCVHFRGNIIKCVDCGHMFNLSFDSTLEACPSCGSKNLIDLAGGFGHGRCCKEFDQRSKE